MIGFENGSSRRYWRQDCFCGVSAFDISAADIWVVIVSDNQVNRDGRVHDHESDRLIAAMATVLPDPLLVKHPEVS